MLRVDPLTALTLVGNQSQIFEVGPDNSTCCIHAACMGGKLLEPAGEHLGDGMVRVFVDFGEYAHWITEVQRIPRATRSNMTESWICMVCEGLIAHGP